jgi:hypothetical protein
VLRRRNILVVVKHIPFFKIIRYLLTELSDIGRIDRVSGYAGLARAFADGKNVVEYDVVLVDVPTAEDCAVIEILRRHQPQAKVALLICDRTLAAPRAKQYHGVLNKSTITRTLLPWLRRTTTATMPNTEVEKVSIAAVLDNSVTSPRALARAAGLIARDAVEDIN